MGPSNRSNRRPPIRSRGEYLQVRSSLSQPQENRAEGTTEGIQPTATNIKHRKFSRKSLIFTVTACLIITAGIGGLVIYEGRNKPPTNPFSPSIMASVQFPLYYPTKLPAGYHIDDQSVTQPQSGVITFDLVSPKGATIYVSEEVAPTTKVLDGFRGNLLHPLTFQTPLGPATYGNLPNGLASVASIATSNKTWLIVNASSSVPRADLEMLLQHLEH